MPDTKIQPAKDDLDHPEEVTFKNAPKLGFDQIESTEEEVTAKDFSNSQKYISRTIQNIIDQGGTREEGYDKARERAIRYEEQSLKDFSEILLDAPAFYETEKEKKELEVKKEQGTNEYKEKKRELSEYNQRIRDLILDNPGKFSKKEFTNWLAKASNNNLAWAEKIMSGVSAEIAIMNACEPLNLVKNVEPGTVEEDLRKIDFKIITQDGTRIKVDAKAGGNQLENGIFIVRGDHIEIGVDNKDIQDDFTLNKEAKSSVQDDLNKYLLETAQA